MMQTLGARASLVFHQLDGLISREADYTVVKSPSRPDFFWGNFLLFDSPPQLGDEKRWTQVYGQHFDVPHQSFISLSWDCDLQGHTEEFLKAGFELQSHHVLKLDSVIHHPLPSQILIKPLQSEQDWSQLFKTQWIDDWPLSSPQEDFLKGKIDTYQRLQAHGYGLRFGAFEGSTLVGDLGVYHDRQTGRFNNVMVHKDHWNRGIARSLVSFASQWALEKWQLSDVVILADQNDYPWKVYEKCGFKTVGAQFELTWRGERWK